MNQNKISAVRKQSIENLTEIVTGMSAKRIQVKKRQLIRNLLKTNKNLLESHNINSLILF